MKCVRCNRPVYLTKTQPGMMCQDCRYRLHIGDPGRPANDNKPSPAGVIADTEFSAALNRLARGDR